MKEKIHFNIEIPLISNYTMYIFIIIGLKINNLPKNFKNNYQLYQIYLKILILKLIYIII